MFTPIAPFAQSISIDCDGAPIPARVGETVAACLLRARVGAFRTTPVSGAPRLPYCMIDHCFDCLVEVDGMGTRQACLCTVRNGMRIRTQSGAIRVQGRR